VYILCRCVVTWVREQVNGWIEIIVQVSRSKSQWAEKVQLVQLLLCSITTDRVDSADTNEGEGTSNSANVDNNRDDDVIDDDDNNDEEGGDNSEVNSESFREKCGKPF